MTEEEYLKKLTSDYADLKVDVYTEKELEIYRKGYSDAVKNCFNYLKVDEK